MSKLFSQTQAQYQPDIGTSPPRFPQRLAAQQRTPHHRRYAPKLRTPLLLVAVGFAFGLLQSGSAQTQAPFRINPIATAPSTSWRINSPNPNAAQPRSDDPRVRQLADW